MEKLTKVLRTWLGRPGTVGVERIDDGGRRCRMSKTNSMAAIRCGYARFDARDGRSRRWLSS